MPVADRKLDFIALGRAAVDLYGEQIGGRLEDMTSFAKYLGGCPANIVVGAARLGLRSAIITRVGNEHMGTFVRETLAAEGVDVSGVKVDPKRLTGLAILGVRNSTTFPLIFYRENCADMAIAADDIDPKFIASAKALVVTGTHFSTAGVDAASRTAMRHARAAGVKVVFDIDYRPVLWGLTGHNLGEERFVASDHVSAHLKTIAPDCDLIVGTEEEIRIAGGSTDTLEALRQLRGCSAAVLVVKRGPEGCVVFPGPVPKSLDDGLVGPGFPVEVFNVLGAGDAFMAGLLRGWLRNEPWEVCCRYANACGALVVSRHGCAPAMPSWIELEEFLRAKSDVVHLHNDTGIARLHRVTTRKKEWPQVCALAFDHRHQFETLAGKYGADETSISHFKSLIGEGAKRGSLDSKLMGSACPGAIIDDRFGRETLYALTGGDWWLARPIERPNSIPLEFEAGPDVALTLRSWPAEHVVKCLVHYQADDPQELRAAQESQLLELCRACEATGHELLLEVIPRRKASDEEAVLDAVAMLYDRGIAPDWWKLPPRSREGWRLLDALINQRDPHCRGVLILGLEAPIETLKSSFLAAAGHSSARGFAVGRSIFFDAAEDWFAGKIDDRTAVSRISEQYKAVIDAWLEANSSSQHTPLKSNALG